MKTAIWRALHLWFFVGLLRFEMVGYSLLSWIYNMSHNPFWHMFSNLVDISQMSLTLSIPSLSIQSLWFSNRNNSVILKFVRLTAGSRVSQPITMSSASKRQRKEQNREIRLTAHFWWETPSSRVQSQVPSFLCYIFLLDTFSRQRLEQRTSLFCSHVD